MPLKLLPYYYYVKNLIYFVSIVLSDGLCLHRLRWTTQISYKNIGKKYLEPVAA